ncbi:TRI56-like protein [Mya arenaria]|uniref:TRI56-like protein n=1 Tax=Mya arenaria TaxID=6604 RepID=A0ABY7FVV9_MYAAR|nr:TRI56-like protein [Mya arenaria]
MESKRAPTKKLAEKWRRPSVSDDVTTCKICSRNLVEPRTLPCMHSFCEECILVLLQCYENQNKLDRTFNCPTCRVRTPCHVLGKVSRHWIKMFPRKQILDSMKEAILVVEEMCNPCSMTWKITPASAFCTECHVYTCAACQIDHKNNPQTKHHHMANYVVKEMKNVPVANISKFNCKQHKNLRYTSFCELHKEFLCNTCRESVAHRNCRVTKRVIEATGNITKAETKLNVINTLKRDERSQGKHLLKLIKQVDAIQGKLERCRQYHVELYCNYVRQATITEQKTEAVDALKGKLVFDKTHQDHDVINNTMTKVEDILTRYVDVFYDVTDAEEKAMKSEINKGILDIEKILARPAFDAFIAKKDPLVTEKPAAAKKPGKEARAVEIPLTKTLPPAKKTDGKIKLTNLKNLVLLCY